MNHPAAIQSLTARHVASAVELHQRVLADEFISRFGRSFLRLYYQAFAASADAVALVAVDPQTGAVIGVLLGTLHPSSHYRFLVRRFGLPLAIAVTRAACVHPKLGWHVIQTRSIRYARGILRSLRGQSREHAQQETPALCTADLTHLGVDPAWRSQGIGSILVQAYEHLAHSAHVDQIDLVTYPPSAGGAGPFYERLGWQTDGQVSRTDEHFVRYTKRLSES